tara:strand:- start:2049 stop:2567 length:519 start_codon:yes stop_codon:yes gene_type:complete
MNSITWRQFGIRLRFLIPAVLTLMSVFVSVLPIGVFGFSEVTPFFALMAVYHWSIYRPELLPAPAVFVLGLLQDGLTGGPLGLFALILIIVCGLASMQRRTFLGKSFQVEWFGFLLVVLGATLVNWLISCVYFMTLVDPRLAVLQGILTLAIYPCIVWIFARIARTALRTPE